MTRQHPLQARLPQQAVAFGLAALVTAGVLAGLQGLAGADHAAQLAQRHMNVPQAIAQVLVAPQA